MRFVQRQCGSTIISSQNGYTRMLLIWNSVSLMKDALLMSGDVPIASVWSSLTSPP